jgi:hypothetical protein
MFSIGGCEADAEEEADLRILIRLQTFSRVAVGARTPCGMSLPSSGHGRFSWETVADFYYAVPDSVLRKRCTRQQACQQEMVEVKQRWTFPKRRKCFLRRVDVRTSVRH